MKFCSVSKFILGSFIVGIGVGIFFCRIFCWGYFVALIFVGIGLWKCFSKSG